LGKCFVKFKAGHQLISRGMKPEDQIIYAYMQFDDQSLYGVFGL